MAQGEARVLSRRPRLKLGRVIGGALSDAARQAPAILAMEAILVTVPAVVFGLPPLATGGPFVALGFAGAEIAAASLFQGLLLRLASGRKGHSGAFDTGAILRLLPPTMALNLLALVMLSVSGVLGGLAINTGLSLIGYRRFGFARDVMLWGGGALSAGAAMLFLTRWAAAAAAVAVEGDDLIGAMLRSSRLVAGRTWRVAVVQGAAFGACFLALIAATTIGGTVANIPLGLIAFTVAAGLIFAVQALAGGRLLHELSRLEGLVDANDLAAVFE